VAEDLCSVPLTIPLRGSIRTNFHELPIQIEFVNGDMLAVQFLTNRADLRLTFISATDKTGKSLDHQSGNWSQWHFWRSLEMPAAGEVIEATFAIHTNLPFTCFVQPHPKKAK